MLSNTLQSLIDDTELSVEELKAKGAEGNTVLQCFDSLHPNNQAGLDSWLTKYGVILLDQAPVDFFKRYTLFQFLQLMKICKVSCR